MTAVRRRLPACVLVLVAGAVLLLVTPAGAQSPIDPNNRPTPLPAVNGEVPPSMLVNVAPACIAARAAAPSLARLFMTARQMRMFLGAEECYRSLTEELRLANVANQPGNNPACVASISRAPNGAPVGTSFHGWGKAADLTDAGGSLTFTSPGYAFMKQFAAGLGWNHPAFAEPGGSACPEAWHWEWVGDGGAEHASPVRGDVVALVPSENDAGYATITGLGALGLHGNFVDRGSAIQVPLAWVIVGATPTPDRHGYWMLGSDGGVFTYGDARFRGSTGGRVLNAPVAGLASSHSGNGYWLVAWDGGVFTFGDARFRGSMGGRSLNAPVDGMAATVSGNGYWLVASDGGIFRFGDARFYGSLGSRRLNAPIVGMAATASGNGYWLVGSDGGVFTFGDARFYGSLGGTPSSSPIVSMTPTHTGHGYWLTRADGTVVAFGDAHFYGSG